MFLTWPAYGLNPARPVSHTTYETWTTNDGLPQNSVNSVFQSADGYLWVGTYEGIARFDGVRFHVFNRTNTPELRSNRVVRIVEDRTGRLWVAFWARGGLVQFRNGVIEKVWTTEDGLSNNQVWDIAEDHHGVIWIATEQGLNRLQGDTLSTEAKVFPGHSITRLLVDRDNTLWIGSNGEGLGRLSEGEFSIIGTDDGLSDGRVRSLVEGRGGSVWVGSLGGLDHLRDGHFVTDSALSGLAGSYVRALHLDPDGVLWVGTFGDGGGITRYNGSEVESLSTEHGITSTYVRCFYEDREGSLWFGTNRGLNRLKDGKLMTMTHKPGLDRDYVRVVVEDKRGYIWMGTDGGGVSQLTPDGFVTLTAEDGLLGNDVRSLAVGSHGKVWIGIFGSGINLYDQGVLSSFTRTDGLPSPWIRALTVGDDGTLWIGTENAGLARFSDGEFSVHPASEELVSPYVSVVVQGDAGRLWLGTPEGLYQLDGDDLKKIELEESASDVVLSLYQDSAGDLWYGTDAGLGRCRAGRARSLGSEHGMIEVAIFQILESDDGALWLSTNNGIYRADKQEVNAVFSGQAERLKPDRYGTNDGMVSSQCNGNSQPAGCRSSDGRLWFPTTDGTVMIDPAQLAMNRLPPPVVIETLVIDNLVVDASAGSEVVVPAGIEQLAIKYTGLSLIVPERVRFRYKMEGLDRGWVEAGDRRTAYYTSISPGTYVFKVTAANNDGVWNTTGATLTLRVKPHLFQTKGFFVSLAACLVALGFAISHFGARRYRQQLEWAVASRTEELALAKEQAEASNLSKSQFLANMSHELRTPLNAITGLTTLALKTDMTTKQRGFLNKVLSSSGLLVDLINDILDLSKIEAQRMELSAVPFRLDDVVTELASIVSPKVSGQGLEVVFTTAREVPDALVGDPLRLKQVLLNLVNNAIKFTESGEILLRIDLMSRTTHQVVLRFKVRDTGIGIRKDTIPKLFESFSQADGTTTRKYGGTGLGLAICKQLVHLMLGEIWVESEPGVGSTFFFTAAFGPTGTATGRSRRLTEELRGMPVLVVDDSESARIAIEEMLTSLSFEVTAVSSGEAALVELARSQQLKRPYKLVVLDWKMPGLDGIGTAIRIREDEYLLPTPPIILVSVYDGVDLVRLAQKGGIDLFVPKPISQSVLFDAVMEVFGVRDRFVIRAHESSQISFVEGTRVLLVEDNSINREVASGFLSGAGLQVVEAVNGQQALEAVEEGSFAAVLMDVQMPVMDGLETTRRLRADARFQELPIIAMTAHAMSGDRERFLEAGMSHYLSKPINERQLLKVLSKWLVVDSEAERPTRTIDTNGLPKLASVDVVKGLSRAGGRLELFTRLVVNFCASSATTSRELSDDLLNGRTKAALDTLHTLRGTAATIAADGVAVAAAELENIVREAGEWREPLKTLGERLNELQIGAEELQKYRDSIPEAPRTAEPLSPQEMAPLLRQLSDLVSGNNLGASAVFDELRTALFESSVRSEAERLESLLDELDYYEAGKCLVELIEKLDSGLAQEE